MKQFLEATSPFAIVLALCGQVVTGAWWASGQTEKMNNIQSRLVAADQQLAADMASKIAQADRMARIEEHIAVLIKTAGEISARLGSIEAALRMER